MCSKQNDPQALGSAITYARRYSLASMLGVMTDEDDDAERAMNRTKSPSQAYKDLLTIKNMYTPELVNAFNQMTPDQQRAEYARVKGL